MCLMTLQNVEETAERGITRRSTPRELVWSQRDDLFLSSKEKKVRKAEHRNDLRGTRAVLMGMRKGVADSQTAVRPPKQIFGVSRRSRFDRKQLISSLKYFLFLPLNITRNATKHTITGGYF